MRPFSEQLSRFRLWRDTNRVEQRLTELGESRRTLGESLMPNRFEAAARVFAQRVAEDVIAERTDLDAVDDGEAYCHALRDLTGMLVDHVAADASEAVELWLETRRQAAQ